MLQLWLNVDSVAKPFIQKRAHDAKTWGLIMVPEKQASKRHVIQFDTVGNFIEVSITEAYVMPECKATNCMRRGVCLEKGCRWLIEEIEVNKNG